MTIMSRFLWWFTARLPMRVINDGVRPYLERYYVGTLFGWRFYIHRFVGSDPDRGLHDHPWSKAHSIILSGWYWEETRSGTRQVRWFNSLTGDTFHRVVLPSWTSPLDLPSMRREQPCWTLFFHRTGKVKPWGFLSEYATSARNENDGMMLFKPHDYSREGRQDNWWLKAPKRGGV